MISEMIFFENTTESELSEAMINVRGSVLTMQVTTIQGYDSTKTQTLKNIGGVIQWVTEA